MFSIKNKEQETPPVFELVLTRKPTEAFRVPEYVDTTRDVLLNMYEIANLMRTNWESAEDRLAQPTKLTLKVFRVSRNVVRVPRIDDPRLVCGVIMYPEVDYDRINDLDMNEDDVDNCELPRGFPFMTPDHEPSFDYYFEVEQYVEFQDWVFDCGFTDGDRFFLGIWRG